MAEQSADDQPPEHADHPAGLRISDESWLPATVYQMA